MLTSSFPDTPVQGILGSKPQLAEAGPVGICTVTRILGALWWGELGGECLLLYRLCSSHRPWLVKPQQERGQAQETLPGTACCGQPQAFLRLCLGEGAVVGLESYSTEHGNFMSLAGDSRPRSSRRLG